MIGAYQRDVQLLCAEARKNTNPEFCLYMNHIQIQGPHLIQGIDMHRLGDRISVQVFHCHSGQAKHIVFFIPFCPSGTGSRRNNIDLMTVLFKLIKQDIGRVRHSVQIGWKCV